MKTILSVIALLLFASCHDDTKDTDPDLPEIKSTATQMINYELKASYPHDTTLFTEGFLFHEGKLFESTGAPSDMPKAKSLIGITNIGNGKFDKKIEIDSKKYFGEGIVFLNGKLYQLTYQNQIGFIYDATTYKQTGQFPFTNKEGWGLTTDGQYIIMSDGSENLTYLDPATMKPVKILKVTENNQPLPNVNELEFINGFIYANVWQTNFIVKIDTASGKVTGKLDLTSLVSEIRSKGHNADVLNGIAFDSANNKIYVTGKLWPNVFQIDFAH